MSELSLNDKLGYIMDEAFSGCTELTSMWLPEGMMMLFDLAFYGCSKLETIFFPKTMTYFSNYTFLECPKLVTVYYEAEYPAWGEDYVFSPTTYQNATLYVPEGGIDNYQLFTPWNKFSNVVGFDFSGVEEIYPTDDAQTMTEVYDLQGHFLGHDTESLNAGIYIIRQGGTTKKISIRM